MVIDKRPLVGSWLAAFDSEFAFEPLRTSESDHEPNLTLIPARGERRGAAFASKNSASRFASGPRSPDRLNGANQAV
jgi:hypothetical protein